MLKKVIVRSARVTAGILAIQLTIFTTVVLMWPKHEFDYSVSDFDKYVESLVVRAEASQQSLEASIYFIDNIEVMVKRIDDSKNKVSRSGDRESKPSFSDVMSLDLRSKSNITAYELEAFFKKNRYKGLIGYGEAFLKAEKKHGVNAVFLVALSIQESGGGKSSFAKNRNNLFGYGANTSNPSNAHYFSSVEDAIMTVASKLANNYLDPNGKYYRGSTLEGVHTLYCTTGGWSDSIARIMVSINISVVNMDIEVREVVKND